MKTFVDLVLTIFPYTKVLEKETRGLLDSTDDGISEEGKNRILKELEDTESGRSAFMAVLALAIDGHSYKEEKFHEEWKKIALYFFAIKVADGWIDNIPRDVEGSNFENIEERIKGLELKKVFDRDVRFLDIKTLLLEKMPTIPAHMEASIFLLKHLVSRFSNSGKFVEHLQTLFELMALADRKKEEWAEAFQQDSPLTKKKLAETEEIDHEVAIYNIVYPSFELFKTAGMTPSENSFEAMCLMSNAARHADSVGDIKKDYEESALNLPVMEAMQILKDNGEEPENNGNKYSYRQIHRTIIANELDKKYFKKAWECIEAGLGFLEGDREKNIYLTVARLMIAKYTVEHKLKNNPILSGHVDKFFRRIMRIVFQTRSFR